MSACGPSRARSISTTPSASARWPPRGRIGDRRLRQPAAMAMASSIGPAPCCSLSAPMPIEVASARRRRRGILRVVQSGERAGDGRRGRRRHARGVHRPRPRGRPACRATTGRRRSSRSRARCGTSPAPPRPGGRATTTATDGAAPMKRRSGPVRLGEQVGPVGDDDDVPVIVAADGRARRRARRRRRRRRRGRAPPAACGSHVHQSHAPGSSATTTSRQSAGPTHVASWTISERTTARAPGPPTASAAPGTEVGRHGGVVEALGGGDDAGQLRRERRRRRRRRRRPTSTGPQPERDAEGVVVVDPPCPHVAAQGGAGA